MKDYVYLTCCVDIEEPQEVDSLRCMVELSTGVTYQTVQRHCQGLAEWAISKGYGNPRGLTLKKDWAVSYHKSTFLKMPCYYVRWSAIEFIWVRKGDSHVSH